MTHLQTDPNFADPQARYLNAYSPGDDFYESLIKAHEGLSEAQSRSVNARLILLLANQVGDSRVLAECIQAAAVEPGSQQAP